MGRKYEDAKSRASIYLGNLASSNLAGLVNEGFDTAWHVGAANPLGAIIFGGMDFLGRLSDRVRDSKFVRISKVGGTLYFAASTAFDLFSIGAGEDKSWVNLLCDAPMTLQLGKDIYHYYGQYGKDILDDFPFLKTVNGADN